MTSNTRKRFVSHIAGIIYDRVSRTGGDVSFDEAVEDAKKINDDKGFTIDIREPYHRENEWARYENVSLDEEEMGKAIKMARLWLEKYP